MKKNFFTTFWFMLAVITGSILYNTSGAVHHINKNIRNIKYKTNNEQHTIAVLTAEFHILTKPDRLERLSKEHLPKLVPMTGLQITSYDSKFPAKKIRAKKLLNIADLIENTLSNGDSEIFKNHKTSSVVAR